MARITKEALADDNRQLRLENEVLESCLADLVVYPDRVTWISAGTPESETWVSWGLTRLTGGAGGFVIRRLGRNFMKAERFEGIVKWVQGAGFRLTNPNPMVREQARNEYDVMQQALVLQASQIRQEQEHAGPFKG